MIESIHAHRGQKYCGYVAIVGRPNVGKSTLMNQLIGQKLSITSRKPQTTRHRVVGIRTDHETQYIFVDTPGFQQKVLNPMNEVMNQSVINTLKQVDVTLWVVDANAWSKGDDVFLACLRKDRPIVIAWNKMDKLSPVRRLSFENRCALLKERFERVQHVLISAKHGQNLDVLLSHIKLHISEGTWLFDEDQITNRDMRFLSSEIIREKLFRHLGSELPYESYVEINAFEESTEMIHMDATIFVDKKSQKPIIIGRAGERLKKIGSEARRDIELLSAKKVFLRLWVKVKESWSTRKHFLRSLGES